MQLRPEHYPNAPKFIHGHNSRKAPQRTKPCACGCGAHAAPGRRFITGHNARGQTRSDETRRKISAAKQGDKNPRHGKLGPESPSWKGGRQLHGAGYILLHCPDHPFAVKRYVFEHRLVVEEHLRNAEPESPFLIRVGGVLRLRREAVVHHLDGVRDHNDLENLQAMWKDEHDQLHFAAAVAARWPGR